MSEPINQAAIDLLREWRNRPPVRELFRRKWFCFALRHGGRSRYPLPALAVMYDTPIYGHSERDFAIIVYWWKWQLRFGFEKRVYATEPAE